MLFTVQSFILVCNFQCLDVEHGGVSAFFVQRGSSGSHTCVTPQEPQPGGLPGVQAGEVAHGGQR